MTRFEMAMKRELEILSRCWFTLKTGKRCGNHLNMFRNLVFVKKRMTWNQACWIPAHRRKMRAS